jgi:uncharacterized membrane protein
MTAFDGLLCAALATGWIAALIALYGRYRPLPSILTGPTICQLEDGGCGVLFRTKEAALLGPPNSLLGSIFYPLLAAGVFLKWPPAPLLAASTFALTLTVWLGYILLSRKLECRVCWTGHISNLVIWLILGARFASGR